MTDKVPVEEIDIEQMKADIEKFRKSNEGKSVALMQATGSPIDPGVLAAIKLEIFIDTFLDENAKVVFAYNFQIRMRKELDDALKELRKAQITDGVTSNKLHIAR